MRFTPLVFGLALAQTVDLGNVVTTAAGNLLTTGHLLPQTGHPLIDNVARVGVTIIPVVTQVVNFVLKAKDFHDRKLTDPTVSSDPLKVQGAILALQFIPVGVIGVPILLQELAVDFPNLTRGLTPSQPRAGFVDATVTPAQSAVAIAALKGIVPSTPNSDSCKSYSNALANTVAKCTSVCSSDCYNAFATTATHLPNVFSFCNTSAEQAAVVSDRFKEFDGFLATNCADYAAAVPQSAISNPLAALGALITARAAAGL